MPTHNIRFAKSWAVECGPSTFGFLFIFCTLATTIFKFENAKGQAKEGSSIPNLRQAPGVSSNLESMRTLRLILILLVGGLLTYLTYKSKFGFSLFDAITWGILILIGLVIFIWTIFKDITLFQSNRRKVSFALTLLCSLFIVAIVTLEIKILTIFKKPTLLKVYYDGDFNGTGIDFKTEGTYIFDNSAIGLSDYYYGEYTITGDLITMDKDQIDNISGLKYLKIKEKKIAYKDSTKNELYLFRVDEDGNTIRSTSEFRVIVDNRN